MPEFGDEFTWRPEKDTTDWSEGLHDWEPASEHVPQGDLGELLSHDDDIARIYETTREFLAPSIIAVGETEMVDETDIDMLLQFVAAQSTDSSEPDALKTIFQQLATWKTGDLIGYICEIRGYIARSSSNDINSALQVAHDEGERRNRAREADA